MKARKPGLILSLSPNYADFAYKLQLQDWRTWVKDGLVDEVVVQLYRPDLESFTAELRRPEFLEKKVPMAVALMAGQRMRPTAPILLQGKVQAARQRGLGVAFFHYAPLLGSHGGSGRAVAGARGGAGWQWDRWGPGQG